MVRILVSLSALLNLALTVFNVFTYTRRKFSNRILQSHDFDWAIRPVILPTYDQITVSVLVTVSEKVSALVLKLYSHFSPQTSARVEKAFRDAVWERVVNGLNHEAQLFAY